MSPVHLLPLTPANFDRHAQALCQVYVACFAEPPWCEAFEPRDVATRLAQSMALDDALLLLALQSDAVVGATLFYPLRHHPAVSALVHPDRAMYCDELFVAPGHQGQGIGSRLFDTATGHAMARGYRRHVLRTSAQAPRLQSFYASRGYQAVAEMQCSSVKHHQGHTQTLPDTRVVMVQGEHHA